MQSQFKTKANREQPKAGKEQTAGFMSKYTSMHRAALQMCMQNGGVNISIAKGGQNGKY